MDRLASRSDEPLRAALQRRFSSLYVFTIDGASPGIYVEYRGKKRQTNAEVNATFIAFRAFIDGFHAGRSAVQPRSDLG